MEKWFTVALLSHKDMDLRDPFFLVKDETLYLFQDIIDLIKMVIIVMRELLILL